MSVTTRRVCAALLLVFGVQLWLVFGGGVRGKYSAYPIVAAILAVAAVPPVARLGHRVVGRLRASLPTAGARLAAGLAVAVAAGAYLFATAKHQRRELFPRWHDEFMHLVQMQHLSVGRLWLPAHPLADFFETFHVLVRPVYASIYFPGASLWYLPTVLFDLPPWLLPLLTTAAAVGMAFAVVSEVMDPVAGAVVSLALVALAPLRMVSLMVMSHPVLLFLGLTLVWTYLRWRTARHWAWAAAMGAVAGWAAVTRPVDSVCWAAPVAVAVLLDLRGCPRRAWVVTIVTGVLAAAPLLSLQFIANRGITGSWLVTPWRVYVEQSQPQFAYAANAFDPTVRPTSALPQKQAYYDRRVVPFLKERAELGLLAVWRAERLGVLAGATVPNGLLLVLLPVALLGLARPGDRRWVLCAPLPLLVLLYLPYAHFIPHYALAAAPAVLVAVAVGAEALGDLWPRARAALATGLPVVAVFLAIASLPNVDRTASDVPRGWDAVRRAHVDLPARVTAPAVVLFAYGEGDPPDDEPVYNVTTPWPDDAAVIRAHDLGARNPELFRYYAARDPGRRAYRFDRASGEVSYLGTVKDLAEGAAP